MWQNLASMQSNVPQVGGMFGQGSQTLMNFAFPLFQQYAMQDQLARGLIPLGFGTGTPFQRMQALN